MGLFDGPSSAVVVMAVRDHQGRKFSPDQLLGSHQVSREVSNGNARIATVWWARDLANDPRTRAFALCTTLGKGMMLTLCGGSWFEFGALRGVGTAGVRIVRQAYQ